MANSNLALYWSVVTALFAFAFMYSWFVAILVRSALANTFVWFFLGLTFYTGANAFIRSGQTMFDPRDIVVAQRALLIIIALDAVIMVIQLGKLYNGAVTERLPLRKQARMIADAVLSKPEGDEREAGTCS